VAVTSRIGLVRDELFLDHEAPGYHPECPERLPAILGALEASPLARQLRPFPARAATVAELERAHDGGYVRRALDALAEGNGYFDPDTYFSPGSRGAALGAAGGCLDAAQALVRGEVDLAFGAVRPPGHHATRRSAMGFCIFNNIAVTAAGLLAGGVERILIFDFDVHHGNGTQDIFWKDPRVLFVSCHLWPHYPGSGLPMELGEGPGRGFSINVPFPHGTGNAEYRSVVEELVEPLAQRFEPQVVLVSAGYDGHKDDPLGGLALDEDGYRMMGGRLRQIADRHAQGRLMFFLEGGYNLEALASSVVATLEGAAAGAAAEEAVARVPEADQLPRAREVLGATIALARQFWPGL
jgi:acetoin utilization deacetylase AcuC-like enzyme